MSSELDELLTNKGKSPNIAISSTALEEGQYDSTGSNLSDHDIGDTIEPEDNDSTKPWYFLQGSPTVLKAGLVYGFFGLRSISAASKEVLKFNRACATNMIDGYCDPDKNQSLVSDFEQTSSITNQIVQIIGLAISAHLSDTYGRKVALSFMFLGCFLDEILFLVGMSSDSFKFKTLIMSYVFDKLLGGDVGLIVILNSYITDITSVETRGASMAFSFSFFYGGQIIGPFIGTVLLGLYKKFSSNPEAGDMLILYVLLGLATISLIYCLAFLPESLPPSVIKAHRISRINQTSGGQILKSFQKKVLSLTAIKSTIWGVIDKGRILYLSEEYVPDHSKHLIKGLRFQVLALVTAYSVAVMIQGPMNTILLQYGIYKFKWNSSNMNFIVMSISSIALFSLLVSVPFVSRILLPKVFKLKFRDGRIDSIDYTQLIVQCLALGFLLTTIGLAKSSWTIMLGFFSFHIGFGFSPCMTSALTKYYPTDKTSQVLLSVTMIGTILSMISPRIFFPLYKWGISIGVPGIPFFVMSSFCLMSLLAIASTRFFLK